MNPFRAAPPVRFCTALLAISLLGGCSTISDWFSGDRSDARTKAANQPLEVPPDLTQLQRDSRYQPQGGIFSATQAGSAPAGSSAGATGSSVAPRQLGSARIERSGQQRWLVVDQSPDQLWPQVRAFWTQNGFKLTEEDAQAGVMQTDWADDRTRIPNDLIRSTLGRVLGNLYDSGRRDLFRTRIERTTTGSEIYLTHRGLEEVFTDAQRELTQWQPRPNDPQLEAEYLARMLTALGGREEVPGAPAASASSAAVATAAATSVDAGTARARLMADPSATLIEVDDPFDRAWRRVGVALDRGGFSVEDRDRTAGLYYVRYVDPKGAGTEEPGWWSKLFGSSKDNLLATRRFRISVKGNAGKTLVQVQNSSGAADKGENAQRIAAQLVKELR